MTDKLTIVGDKLDAAEKAGRDHSELLYRYRALAVDRALAIKPPRIKIKNVASYWTADAAWRAATDRGRQIERDLESAAGTLRDRADLEAAYIVAQRDSKSIFDAISTYETNKKAKIKRWRDAARAVRIPERDRLPQR